MAELRSVKLNVRVAPRTMVGLQAWAERERRPVASLLSVIVEDAVTAQTSPETPVPRKRRPPPPSSG